jgi:serine O-acetyltransferase
VGDLIDRLHDKLMNQIVRAMRHEQSDHAEGVHIDLEALAQQKAVEFLRRLPHIRMVLEQDAQAAFEGDPAAKSYHEIVFCYPGVEAVTVYRIAHELLLIGVPLIPRMMAEAAHSKTGIDIHPGARIGPGFFIDHGTGVVIGETAVVEDNVSLLHEVTLGGTGKETGDRHPKVRHGVLIGAGAKVLGNIEIGAGSKVGAGSVVLDPVPPHRTVAGVPAKIVGRPEVAEPALDMDQQFPHAFDDGGGI